MENESHRQNLKDVKESSTVVVMFLHNSGNVPAENQGKPVIMVKKTLKTQQ